MGSDSEMRHDREQRLAAVLALIQKGDLGRARRLLEDLASEDPTDSIVLYNLGLSLNDLGDFEAARTTLLRVIDLKPAEANPYVALGLAEAKLGRMDEAEAHLEKALVLEPDNPYALRNMASIHAATGRLPLALEELLRVAALLPDDPPTVYGLGLVYRALGRIREATGAFKEAVALQGAGVYPEMARDQLRQIAEESFTSHGPRTEAVLACYEALTRFAPLSDDALRDVIAEIGLLGRQGLDPHDAGKKYRLHSLDGEFTGLQLICHLYVGMKRVAPEQDIGFDLAQEYQAALAWHAEPRA